MMLLSLFMEQPKYFPFLSSLCKDPEETAPQWEKGRVPRKQESAGLPVSSSLSSLDTSPGLSDLRFHTCRMMCLD